jgi:uncharacterized protein YjbJ (UPF0337 family)
MSGEFDQVKGRVKQGVGALTDDERLEREGERDEFAGKVKEKIDDAGDAVKRAVEKVRDKAD